MSKPQIYIDKKLYASPLISTENNKLIIIGIGHEDQKNY